MELPIDFYKKVEDREYLKHVIYGDTDSVFLVVPTDVKDLAATEKIKIATKVSKDINDKIADYLNNNYFKKANISNDYNFTDFKTELIMESIMFIPDIKKQYAYKIIVKDNKILLDTDKRINYKGIQVVRIDAAKLGQRLLVEIIENIVLNSNIKKEDKIKYVLKAVNDTHNEFLECINTAKFEDIGISCKWGKDNSIINSMKLYNFIFNDNTFTAASAGRFVYCKFRNTELFKTLDIDLKKLNAIAIPYNYSPELVKSKFDEFGIQLDEDMQWARVYTTTCQRIVDLVKKESKEK
jgi:hypothetical protein